MIAMWYQTVGHAKPGVAKYFGLRRFMNLWNGKQHTVNITVKLQNCHLPRISKKL